MKLTRSQVQSLLSRMLQGGVLPHDGPLSLFLTQPGRSEKVQLVIVPEPDRVLVKTSRLPFIRPMAFEWWEIT